MRFKLFALSGAAMLAVAAPLAAAPQAPVPVADLVAKVRIPYEAFTLANGLRVIVHTDRKAPVVALSVWYNVGSKMEPKGKTGFAHLYEHLMFYGSQHAPQPYFESTNAIGATDLNGTTWFDRTNYFETVPTPALERALFLESDRMGWLLPAMDQKRVDTQRGVVQNEKRQGDNEPFGLVDEAQLKALFPDGHPYQHSTIGSMADLDAASLEDVKGWFRDHYGPNNAVLVLAGDIDAATAKPLVEKYFGNIPRGPAAPKVIAPVPTLKAPITEVMKDHVATTRLYRDWVVPGLLDPQSGPLTIGASVLGGLSSSRLDNILVRQEKLAVSVSASVQSFAQVSQFEVTVDVAPGADVAAVSKRLDAIIADLVAKGPSADEVERVKTSVAAGRIKGLESVGGFGGKAVALAEGALYANDPDFYKKRLEALAATTPAQVTAMLQKWLSRPVYALTVVPGDRDAYQEAAAKPATTAAPAPAVADVSTPGGGAYADRSTPPSVGAIADLVFPKIEHAKLANGIAVDYAQRTTVPVTQVAVQFDAGNAADPKAKLGTQSLMLALLTEGTTTRSAIDIAETKERLGAAIGSGPSMDRTAVSMTAMSPNLAPSLDLLADIIRNPAFKPEDVERLRVQQLTSIASEMTQPVGLALRTLPPLMYGPAHPYGVPFTGSGVPAGVKAVTRDDLVAFHDAWLRPDKAKIFIVSDLPLATVLPQLEAAFGKWTATGTAGVKSFTAAIPESKPHIVLIDRPGSPQSLLLSGQVTAREGTDDLIAFDNANDVFGGDTSARLSADLRDTKGWSYGAYSFYQEVEHRMPFFTYAPVQADKTGPAVQTLIDDTRAFLTTKGVTDVELGRAVEANIRKLPGSFETSGAVLAALERIDLFKRPDDYYVTLAQKYRALTRADLDAAARATIDPSKTLWLVVGEAKTVKPQLDSLGLPVEVVGAAPAQ